MFPSNQWPDMFGEWIRLTPHDPTRRVFCDEPIAEVYAPARIDGDRPRLLLTFASGRFVELTTNDDGDFLFIV